MCKDYLLCRLTARQQENHEQVLESRRVCDCLRRQQQNHEQYEQALQTMRVSDRILT